MLEAIVQNLEDAIEAERVGIDRLELVSCIERDGLTPSLKTTKEIIEHVKIPVQVMIRSHAQGFCYSESDVKDMMQSIEQLKSVGANRFVIGGLTAERTIDVQLLDKIITEYPTIEITFHRAFDHAIDVKQAYLTLIPYKKHIKRILTSGGAPNCLAGVNMLLELVLLSERKNGPLIMPGAGITSDNFASIHKKVQATEYHFGKGVRLMESFDNTLDRERITRIKSLFNIYRS